MKPFVPVDSVLVASSASSGLLRVRGNPAGRSGRENDPRLRGRAHPADLLRELRGHPEVPPVFATGSRPAKPQRVDDPRRSSNLQHSTKGKTLMNPNPTTFTDLPTGLSNLLGAYDEGHWQTASRKSKPASASSRAELSSRRARPETSESSSSSPRERKRTAYGVLLDEAVDTCVAYSDGSVTGSIAKAGIVPRSRAHRPDGRRRRPHLGRASRSRHLRRRTRSPFRRQQRQQKKRPQSRSRSRSGRSVVLFGELPLGRSCPDSLFGATGTLVPNEKRV